MTPCCLQAESHQTQLVEKSEHLTMSEEKLLQGWTQATGSDEDVIY